MGTKKVPAGFSWGDLMKTDQLEELSANGWVILKWIFKIQDEAACTGLLCLRMGTGNRSFVNAAMKLRVS